ncbi:MAG: hypothetical protein IKZ47_06585 [Clostridia bacterium]|nr:hypothetical protein [Clostridia bacterium]
MLDLHTHILPAVDDGARTAEEGVALLRQMQEQGVTAAVATPHFFPGSMELEDFLERRNAALKELTAAGGDIQVKIIAGAEVLYFGGIGRFENVRRLTVGGSRYLLLELLGVKAIDEKVIKDITDLGERLDIIPVIAHTERYCRYKGYRKLVSAIADGRALCQINAGFSGSKPETRAVKKLLRRGLIDFIASDCHSPVSRPVKIEAGIKALRMISATATNAVIKKCNALEEELNKL